jgi:DNA-binding NtrC family response regulator
MTNQPTAVVIEPRSSLADTAAEVLRHRGYETLTASTHASAAGLVEHLAHVDFLAASVPAPGEDRTGAYLEKAREKNPSMAIVIMLSDPDERAEDAPLDAVRLTKPFGLEALESAIDRARATVGHG